MATADGDVLKSLFAELRSNLKAENHEAVISIAQRILSKAPGDSDALRVKVIAYLHLGKYNEALTAAAKAKDGVSLAFERAYALYRLNRTDDALAALSKLSDDDDDVLHLRAQTLFKANRVDEAADVYVKLYHKRGGEHGEDAELATNLYTALLASGRGKEALDSFPVNEGLMDQWYELACNSGSALIDHGDLGAAEERLREAQELCERQGEEDGLAPDKILDEGAAIQLELAYAQQLHGRRDEAVERLTRLTKAKLTDPVSRLVAVNNLAALKGDKELRAMAKKLKAAAAEADAKLLPSQRSVWRVNQALVALRTNKTSDATAALQSLDTSSVPSWLRGLLDISVNVSTQPDYKPETDLRALLSSSDGADEEGRRRVSLVLAQALVDRGNFNEAVEVLEGIASLKGCPGMAATLANLHARAGDAAGALRAFNRALEVAEAAEARAKLLQGAAALRMQAGQYREAAQAYRELLESGELEGEERLRTTANLVVATSWYDPQAAEELADSLPVSDLFDQAAELTAEDLEKEGLPRTHRSRVSVDMTAAAKEKKRKVDPEKRRRRREKLKQKYIEKLQAEGRYDPKRQPDPERWISKSQRSYNKRGRRGRTKFVGAQGSGDGAQKDAARLDVASRVAAAKKAQEEQGGGSVEEKKVPPAGRRKRR